MRDEWGIIYARNVDNYQIYSMGCAIDSINKNVFLFGGFHNHSQTLNTIQTYNFMIGVHTVLSDTLSQSQHSLTVTKTMGIIL